MSEGNFEIPSSWINAEDRWEEMKRLLPADLPEEAVRGVERAFGGVLQRVYETAFASKLSVQVLGLWPEGVVESLLHTVSQMNGGVMAALALEVGLLRIELEGLKARLDGYEP